MEIEKGLATYEVGEMIADRYRVLGRLGKGGMASVWRAVDTIVNTEVAVKVALIPADVERRERIISRYENELTSFLALQTERNVVKLYDMFKTKDSVIIVMECVDGGTYKNRYSDSNDMTLDEIKFYFSRLCSALTSTEKSGIVHRDLKPDNILISAEGEIKLGDYGIAVLKDDDFEARLVIGTPKYMSPESTVGLQLSKLSDIYSLGVMLYESATGTWPFSLRNDPNNKGMLMSQRDWKPIEPRRVNKWVPQALENLIMQMLEKDPALRPQSAAEVREKLMAITENSDEVIKPYVYRSKTFSYLDTASKMNKVTVGSTYDKISNRFRTKYMLLFVILLVIVLLAIVIEMAVLI